MSWIQAVSAFNISEETACKITLWHIKLEELLIRLVPQLLLEKIDHALCILVTEQTVSLAAEVI